MNAGDERKKGDATDTVRLRFTILPTEVACLQAIARGAH